MDKGDLGKGRREEAYTVWGDDESLKERERKGQWPENSAHSLQSVVGWAREAWDGPEKRVWVRNKHAPVTSLEGLWFCSCVTWKKHHDEGYDWILLFGLVTED